MTDIRSALLAETDALADRVVLLSAADVVGGARRRRRNRTAASAGVAAALAAAAVVAVPALLDRPDALVGTYAGRQDAPRPDEQRLRQDAARRAESLWSARVPYVGDNSGVTSLIDEIGVAGAGGYKVELRTTEPPYALAISLQDSGKPFDATDFSGHAVLLLGLVANLDEVSITAGQDSYSLAAAAASRDLGHDVKLLGRDRASLVRYLERARS